MVDNVGGASGGDSMMAQLLQSALSASQAQNNEAQNDDKRSDAVHRQLLQKYTEKKQVQESHAHAQEVKESYTSERAVDKQWRAVAEGKAGPELMQFANQPNLQGKVSGKLKEMFLNAAAADPGRAQDAAAAMNRLSTAQTFNQVAPTARDVGDLAARVLQDPGVEKTLSEALNHPFTQAKEGDKGAKQDLARFASRQTDAQAMGRGASVRMAGDMLGTLAGAKVPGFAQQASMKMIERNPQNTAGAKNIDAFVQEPAVRAMPSMARGYATQVLAKGDGKADLKQSLTEVAKNDNFRGMGREDKGKLFATVGQGRAGDLRVLTDQTLSALRQKDFPRQAHQVESFLGALGRGVLRSTQQTAGAKEGGPLGGGLLDPEELVSTARRGGLPERPTLRRIPGSAEGSDEASARARGGNGLDASNLGSQEGAEAAGGSELGVTQESVLPQDGSETQELGEATQKRLMQGASAQKGVARGAGATGAAGEVTATQAEALQQAGETQKNLGAAGPERSQRTLTAAMRPNLGRSEHTGKTAGSGLFEGSQTSVDAQPGATASKDPEEEARQVGNRGSLQAYFGKITRHYDRLEQKIKDAQYFEDVNMLSGLKEPEELDLSGLSVRPDVAKTFDQKLAELKTQLDGRQMPRATYVKQLKAVQSQAFARQDLTTDEKSYVYAKTAQAQAGQTFQELSGKKHRKLREVKNKLLPAEKRRARLEPRRPQGAQPRFFRAGSGQAGGTGGTRRAGGSAGASSAASGPATGAAGGAQSRRTSSAGAQTQDILRRLDPSLSPNEQLQQAKELMAQDIQRQAMQMASELMDAIFSGHGGVSNKNLAHGSEAGGSSRVAATQSSTSGKKATTTGKANFYGVPQSFERDLGVHAGSRPVRKPGTLAPRRGEDDASVRQGRSLMKDNAQIRSLQQLRDVKMKDMSKLEANALKNLGWDAVSWGAQGQQGANIPTTYRTDFDSLRPLQKDSARALGLDADGWNRMAARNRSQDDEARDV